MTADPISETPGRAGAPPEQEPDDLGFGRVAANAARGRFFARDGTPTSRKYGMGAQRAERLYLAALNARWPQFLLWLLGALLLLNGFFALAFRALGSGALAGAETLGLQDPFLRALAYSVGTFTTTGIDGVHAVGTTATWLSILESVTGVLFFVSASGLLIARLTRPRMRLGFSESAVVAPYEGGRGFMFRMVNLQPGELSDVRARVTLIWFEDFDTGRERNFHDLELERNQVEMFSLHWTVVHPITERSPLKGVTPEELAARQAEFVIAINAHEHTFSTRVRTLASYTWEEVRWDARFASIFTAAPDGVLAIDVERLSRLEPLEEGATRRPAAIELV